MTVTSFGFYFPSFDITGTCKPAGGQDLGDMEVGSGLDRAAAVARARAADATTTAAGDTPAGTDPAAAAGGEAAGGVDRPASQNIAVVDVRLEGSRTVGRALRRGAAAHPDPGRAERRQHRHRGACGGRRDGTLRAAWRRPRWTSRSDPLAPQQMQRIEVPMAMPRGRHRHLPPEGQVGSSANGELRHHVADLPVRACSCSTSRRSCCSRGEYAGGWLTGVRRPRSSPRGLPTAGRTAATTPRRALTRPRWTWTAWFALAGAAEGSPARRDGGSDERGVRLVERT